MNKRILVGIDPELSPPTQHVLHVVSEFFELPSSRLWVALLTVIPTLDTSLNSAWNRTPFLSLGSTAEQRLQADRVLRSACLELAQRSVASDRIDLRRREGAPADEIVRAALELGADCIVLGSHESSPGQRLRRLLCGSTSRLVLQRAPCPVLLAVCPRTSPPGDLVAWYEEAVRGYLHEQAGRLTILVADEVARTFAPAQRTARRKEVAAATRALERLEARGLLCCRRVAGELHCTND